jgi:septum formation protein
MKTFVLASQSPRRKELLEKAGYKFYTFSVKISEFLDKNLMLDEAIQQIARQKAEACVEQIKPLNLQNILILSSDTVVVIDGEVLGKPQDQGQAFEYLRRLSGRTHEVKTSVCLLDSQTRKTISEIESSFVTFRNLSDKEIHDYILSGEPMDKAGAYGIQGAGGKFIAELKGNLDNVMGLPVQRVEKILKSNGWWDEINQE